MLKSLTLSFDVNQILQYKFQPVKMNFNSKFMYNNLVQGCTSSVTANWNEEQAS